jgi:predicted acylesterase/phospholipase RssA
MLITSQLVEIPADRKPGRKKLRIGLALSGGGFRAAIFHLGVIRRLEELGIMPKIDVISAVSGGSIIAAYYLCEMERRLRLVPTAERRSIKVRVRIFEEIAENFLAVLDKNLRNRALLFTPFYHPLLFIKTLFLKAFRSTARSELMEREYDRWFYKGDTLDQLPSTAAGTERQDKDDLLGPKLLINTTSLLSGERVTFSREPVSRLNEMSKVNDNVLPLSRVVGASAGVPGLFPPTLIAGEVLVDGGVADNQGIESLIDDPALCNVLLVSDACGQMEALDTIGRSVLAVVSRVNGVLQFQVRDKLIDNLVGWKHLADAKKVLGRFAFIHLFLNLKDRPNSPPRVSAEFIASIGRIRTDLDQFSHIEVEALMYHGYTLIDSQIKEYCDDVRAEMMTGQPEEGMRIPPLFRENVQKNTTARREIRNDLEAGSQNLYLLRCAKKYPCVVWPVLALGCIIAALILILILFVYPQALYWLTDTLSDVVQKTLSWWVVTPLNKLLGRFGLIDLSTSIRGLSGILSFLILFLLPLYVISFPVYAFIRRYAACEDRKAYKALTDVEPSAHWDVVAPGAVTPAIPTGEISQDNSGKALPGTT